MLLAWGGGTYKEVCFAYLMLGGCGGMLPQEKITSGAFSSKFTRPRICIYYTLLTMQPCIKKNPVATKFQGGGGGEMLARGGQMPPPPPPPPPP